MSRIDAAVVPVGGSPPLYCEDALAEPLPTINTQRTLAAKLCGQVDNVEFNAKVIALTQRLEVMAHVAIVLVAATALPLFVVADVPTRQILSGLIVLPAVFCLVYICASLSWDMLRLTMQTFEFWFLSLANAVNALSWCLLVHDSRVITLICMGSLIAAILCIDAVTCTRYFVARGFVIGSPIAFIILALAASNVTPDLHYETLTVLGVDVDAIDVMVNCNLVIAYFTAVRVFRLRKVVFGSHPIHRVQCGMWYPYSSLVPQTSMFLNGSPRKQDMRGDGNNELTQQLKLADSFATRDIDITEVVWPQLTGLVRQRWPRHVSTAVGFASHLMLTIAGYRTLSELNGGPPTDRRLQVSFVNAVISFAGAIVVFITYVAHCQRQLLKRVLQDMDAWFVSFQMTVVAVGFSDLVAWESRLVLPLLTAWIWCHWTICLDAVPPVTRQRLGYSRHFARLTCVMLAVFPVALGYMLFHSTNTFAYRDRVLMRVDVGGGMHWQIRLRGFLASKLIALEVWMLRFLWREIVRPADAFKLIKRRVYYDVGSVN